MSCSPVAPIIAPIGHYLFVVLTPEQIIMTYLPCHLTYQSACVNTGLGLRLKKGFRVTAQPHLCHDMIEAETKVVKVDEKDTGSGKLSVQKYNWAKNRL